MFNFTTTLGYCLRLLANLAGQENRLKPLKRIAEEENISLLYLRKLAAPLEKAGIIKSIKGPGGGYSLAKSPCQINLLEIIDIFNRGRVVDCLKKSSQCLRYQDCAVKSLLEEVTEKIRAVFEDKTLKAIIKKKK
jgi:Rrf2 family iron-sulfur cluster assembly transcriptional regulator